MILFDMTRHVQQQVAKDSVTEFYIAFVRYTLNSPLPYQERRKTLRSILGIASENPLKELTERYLTYIENNPNHTSQKKRELVGSAFQVLVHELPPRIALYFQAFLDGLNFLQGFRERYGLKIYEKQQRRDFETTSAKKFTRRKKAESTQRGKDYQQDQIHRHKLQNKPGGEILILDENFSEVSLDSLKAVRNYIEHGCYLTARQLQTLTGLPYSEVVRRAVELKINRRVIKERGWYLMNADIYAKISEKIQQGCILNAETQNQGKTTRLEDIIDTRKQKDQERIHLQDVIYQAGFPTPQNIEVSRLCEGLGIQIDVKEPNPTLPKQEAKKLLLALKKERIAGQPTYQG